MAEQTSPFNHQLETQPSLSVIESQENEGEDPVLAFRDTMEQYIQQVPGRIVILPHQNIDLDCIGSSIALRNVLQAKYPDKEIVVIISDNPTDPRSVRQKKYTEQGGVIWDPNPTAYIPDDGMVIMVDTFEWVKAGVTQADVARFEEKQIPHLIFDHHPSRKSDTSPDINIATTSYVEETASSASELVARMCDISEIDAKTARLLALGILNDTGGLSYIRADNSARALPAFQKVLEKCGGTIEDLKNELNVPLKPEEYMLKAKMELTRRDFTIPEISDHISLFIEPDDNPFPADIDEALVTDRVLNNVLTELGSDFAVYVKPVTGTK